MAAKKQISYEVPEYIPCAFAGCPTSATIKTRTKTGWANVCERCYVVMAKKQADEKCRAMGLDTVEKQKAWLKARGGFGRVIERLAQREPGEDWGEEAA